MKCLSSQYLFSQMKRAKALNTNFLVRSLSSSLHNALTNHNIRFEDEWLKADMNYSRKVAIKKLPENLKNAVEKKIFGGKNQDKKLRKTLKSSVPSKLT